MSTCTHSDKWKQAQLKTREFSLREKESRIANYNSNPSTCKTCSGSLPYEKRKNSFCSSSCAARFNNIGVVRHHSKSSTALLCIRCNKLLGKGETKYCSTHCCGEHRRELKTSDWLSNPSDYKTLPSNARFYLIAKSNNRCSLCGWGEKNPHSNTYPLVIDHIDGNAENNHPDNLRVLCPNCDSLTSTYKSLNKGNGRAKRRQRYKDGKSY